MSDLARRYRQARAERGIGLLECERALRIRSRYLEAIEAGDFERLPDGPAGRGFIKNYARHLGLNPEDCLSAFEAEVGVPIIQLQEEVPPQPERQRQQSKFTQTALPELRYKGDLPSQEDTELDLMADDDLIDLPEASSVPEITRLDGTTGRALVIRPNASAALERTAHERHAMVDRKLRAAGSSFRLDNSAGRRKPSINTRLNKGGSRGLPGSGGFNADQLRPFMPFVLGALGIAAAATLLWFVILPLGQTAAASIQSGIASLTGAPQTTPQTGPRPVARVTIIAPAAPAQQADTAVTPAPQPTASDVINERTVTVPAAAGGGLQISLDARERAPVKIIIDGNLVFQGIPNLGPNPTWNANRSVIVETFNAGAFDILVNGERQGAPGQRNEKIRVTYTL
jgi:Helix-turn-helix domain